MPLNRRFQRERQLVAIAKSLEIVDETFRKPVRGAMEVGSFGNEGS
jgi:hypothetical protein